MFRFVREAQDALDSLSDRVTLAATSFSNVLTYFGEESTSNTTTNEFFGNLNTFVAAYKVGSQRMLLCIIATTHSNASCVDSPFFQRVQAENQTVAEQKAAQERRRAAREAKSKPKVETQQATGAGGDGAVMDDLFAKLREGQGMGRRAARRSRKAHGERVQSPTSPTTQFASANPAEAARGMLMQLKGDGVSRILLADVAEPSHAQS